MRINPSLFMFSRIRSIMSFPILITVLSALALLTLSCLGTSARPIAMWCGVATRFLVDSWDKCLCLPDLPARTDVQSGREEQETQLKTQHPPKHPNRASPYHLHSISRPLLTLLLFARRLPHKELINISQKSKPNLPHYIVNPCLWLYYLV